MPILIKIAMILAVTGILIKISDLIFGRLARDRRIHMKFMQGVAKAAIAVGGVVVLGKQFEITKELSSILLTNTALLVAVLGFAAQQTLNDILSGFMISWYKPFDIGMRIHLVSQNISGIVEDISLRHTVIRCFDNNRIIIPNSIINKEILKNSNYEDSVIGNYLEIKVSADSDVRMAMETVDLVIRSHSSVITNPIYTPGILVKDFTKDGYILKATVWTKNVDDNFAACSDIRISIREKFKEVAIDML